MKSVINLCLLIYCVGWAAGSSAQVTDSGNVSPTILSSDTSQATIAEADSTKIIQPPVIKPIARQVRVKRPKPIRTEISGGIRLNSNGWGLFVDKGWVKSEEKLSDYFYNARLLQLEFNEVRHPKEMKRSNNPSDNSPMAFAYGKINNFYTLKLGYGARKMIAGKPEHGTVSIHWVYLGGLSAGLQKPYYLEVQRGNGGPVEAVKYTDSTERRFLGLTEDNGTLNFIVGNAGFAKGLNEIKVIPGVHFKTGLHFDFAPSKTMKLAVETGINAELYMKNIELMALQKAVPYNVSLYASFQFGKRKQ